MPKKRCQLKQQLWAAQNGPNLLEVFFTPELVNERRTVRKVLREKQLPASLKFKVHQKVFCNDHNVPKLPELEDLTNLWDWSMLIEQMHSITQKSTIVIQTIIPSETKKAMKATDPLNFISFIKRQARTLKLLAIWPQPFLTLNDLKDSQVILCSLIHVLIYKLEIQHQSL
jgi:hypothetical protein